MITRRDFTKTVSAAALGYAFRPLAPNPRPLAPSRKLDRVGLQLYTVRDRMAKDVDGTLAEVAAAGYREVEFAGYFGKSPQEIRAMLVQLEMDLYWITKGGQDPLAYFARYPGRFPMVHVKDSMGPPENKMADVGAGTIDFKKIFAQRDQAGIRHFFVEHDQPADALASIKASCDYLKRLEF